jgi:hypothetical protein
MANQNCLQNIQCPNCKSEGPFVITVETNVLMNDDGWTETSGDTDDWGSWSYIRCDSCDEVGIVREFTLPYQNKSC